LSPKGNNDSLEKQPPKRPPAATDAEIVATEAAMNIEA